MKRRHRDGQHFLTSDRVAARIVGEADIRREDTVLEIGTGRGILTRLLCEVASQVISIESDQRLYEEARETLRYDNLVLLHRDGFGTTEEFDVFISNLPYSHSRRAVEWLAATPFRCGVIMVQEEFARKITRTGLERRAVSIVWQEAFDVNGSFRVGPHNFAPPPRVDSRVVRFQKRRTISTDIIQNLHLVFSRRRKIIHTAQGDRRLGQLNNTEVMQIAESM